MILKRIPWKYMLKKVAGIHGFIDPIDLMERIQRFAQPSEVREPVELLRAGVAFHARGLINTRAIQHNLDWVWPYWVERQFDPTDPSFVPRAFSFSHINLTHRNWTAVGVPDCTALPIVDPRGMVTPWFDGWSLDFWILSEDNSSLFPSRCTEEEVVQKLVLDDDIPAIETVVRKDTLRLKTRVEGVLTDSRPICRIKLEGESESGGWLVASVRPCNPEGVSFISDISLQPTTAEVMINNRNGLRFEKCWDMVRLSDYRTGDVSGKIPVADSRLQLQDPVGMATAAFLYKLPEKENIIHHIDVNLSEDPSLKHLFTIPGNHSWKETLKNTAQLQHPNKTWSELYDTALRSLILHSPDDVYPGPFTYKRFWYRDAAFITAALLSANLTERAERQLERFPSRQRANGYYCSQEGEWDSNGQVLWIYNQFLSKTSQKLPPKWLHSIIDGARWILAKRTRDKGKIHEGLMPAGFSAEHLGMNDFYYWDDFWSIAGLRAAAEICSREGHTPEAEDFESGASQMLQAVEQSLHLSEAQGLDAYPASPYRRMDAGAVGSLTASYPLHLTEPQDKRIKATADFLMNNCLVKGGFFQDMIHSGINAYLTLHLAQVLLRAGDERCFELIKTVANLASPTGQWPEAIHPQTDGGCMGDGHHIWAAAEWVLMMRSLFVREENTTLILCPGIKKEELIAGNTFTFGPTPTRFGPLTIQIECKEIETEISWQARWHTKPETIRIQLFDCPPQTLPPDHTPVIKLKV